MKTFKLGLVQMSSEFGAVSENVNKAEKYIRKAALDGAELIALPEMFNTGINFNNMKEDMKFAEKTAGKTLTHMRELAKELGVYLLSPILVERGKNVWENTAFLLDKQGEILGSYAKTHPVGDERKLLQRGKEYPVLETEFGKIGIMICYDACFPETSRLLTLNGAELILVPAAWRGSHYFKEWWDINIQCRALDNLVYVGAINACGATGDGTEMYAGKSQIVNPIGEVQKRAGVEAETIIIQDIYMNRVAKEREFNTVLIDRHPEDYKMLSEK